MYKLYDKLFLLTFLTNYTSLITYVSFSCDNCEVIKERSNFYISVFLYQAINIFTITNKRIVNENIQLFYIYFVNRH